jgi:hypothetical protein
MLMNIRAPSAFPTQEETVMKRTQNRQVKIPGRRDQCVETSCAKFGVGPKEAKKMIQLLGKRAPIHEIAANWKERPPKFR